MILTLEEIKDCIKESWHSDSLNDNTLPSTLSFIDEAYQAGRESMRKEIEAELPGEEELDRVTQEAVNWVTGFNDCLNQVKSIIGKK